ncbi:MAG: LytTR family DNA-binding domain-containing protein [Deltaproteobacteria bacterium]|nr:LytTR family DNA-binding domain-containing protein [Deltaproteobacteria bacterium]
MTSYRVLLADDEPLARELLFDLLSQDPEVEVVAQCGDGASALRVLREARPDIAFLDVEMPEGGGLEVAKSLKPTEMPALVFVTAYGHYATDAFEVEALDYVVKPFSDERLFAALARAKKRIRHQKLGDLARQIATLSAPLNTPMQEASRAPFPTSPKATAPSSRGFLERIPVGTRGRQRFIATEDILWIESDDYLARIHIQGSSRLVRLSLTWFEQHLDPRRFVRTHRKAIVNLSAVTALETRFKGKKVLELSDGSHIPISRSRRRAVEEALLPASR